MSAIRVFKITRPKRGKYIPEGNYTYTKSEDGSPAMRFRWKGIFLPGNEELFLFATQSEIFGLLDPKFAHGAAKWGRDTPPFLGLLPSVGIALAQAATTKTEGTKGFAVFYRNPEGQLGSFWAIAPADIVDEMIACVPREKVADDSNPKPEQS